MTRRQIFIRFVQIYAGYLLKDDDRLSKEESKDLDKRGVDFFKTSAIYTCCSCGNRVGLSFIEKNHSCINPMFDRDIIPIESRVIEECDSLGLNFQKIIDSVKIKRPQKVT